jgi:hypothetical protein
VPPLPDTTKELPGCPDVCKLRKTNVYVAARQREDISLSAKEAAKLAKGSP